MLQGSGDANRPERPGSHGRGTASADPVHGWAPPQRCGGGMAAAERSWSFAAEHRITVRDLRPRGTPPQVTAKVTPPDTVIRTPLHRHDAAERQVLPTTSTTSQRLRRTTKSSHSTSTPPRSSHVPSEDFVALQPGRTCRPTPVATRHSQPRPRPPSMDTAAGAAISSVACWNSMTAALDEQVCARGACSGRRG